MVNLSREVENRLDRNFNVMIASGFGTLLVLAVTLMYQLHPATRALCAVPVFIGLRAFRQNRRISRLS